MDNAGEQRIPRGGSLQESKFQVWPAAIRPQSPSGSGRGKPQPLYSRHPQYDVHPEEPLSWGSTSHYEPPGREARSLQACVGGHAVEVCKIRYSGRSACEGAT